MALRLWASEWQDSVICIRCDNESVVTVCNSSKTCDQFLNMCLCELWLLVSRFNIVLCVSHIRRKDNVLADALSRNTLHKVGYLGNND